MNFDDIINRVNHTVLSARGRPLTDVQRVVLKGSWDNQTYAHMATAGVGYTEDYLKKDVGPKLWQLLSDVTGIPVNKRNIRNAMLQWVNAGLAEPEVSVVTVPDVPTYIASKQELPQSSYRLALCHTLRIDVSEFSGREAELAELAQWIRVDGCRLILLWGLPDVGKTALAVKVAEQVRDEFDLCGYLDLSPDLSPDAFLGELVRWLGATPPASEVWETQIDWMIDHLAQRRCLLLVDNAEALFQTRQLVGTYRESYAPYQRFLEKVAELRHRSCILWISQERLPDFASLQGRLVRSHQVREFSAAEVSAFLTNQGWPAAPADQWQALINTYGGIPRLLKSLTPALDMHGGSLPRLLESELAVSESERRSLTQALDRLSLAEQEVLYWLAMAQAPLPLEELRSSMVQPPEAPVIQSLLHRAFCFNTKASAGADTVLDLNPVIRDLAVERVVQILATEITRNQPDLFHRLPLLRVTAPEAVQARQDKEGLQPLQQLLRNCCPSESALAEQMQTLHRTLRTQYLNRPGYGAGNLINLCQALGLSLSGFDFSHLVVWQANLQRVSLQGANLSHVYFQDTVFATALGRDPVVAFSQDGQNLAVGDHEGSLLHWELQRGKLLRFLEDGSRQAVGCLAFSPLGDLLAVGSEDATVQLWRLEGTYEADLPLLGHQAVVRAIAFSPRGDLLATGDDQGHLYLWDLASGTPRWVIDDIGEALRTLHFDAEGARLIGSGEGQSAWLWDVQSGNLITPFQAASTAWIRTVGFISAPAHPEVATQEQIAFAAGCDDRCLYLWDVEAGQPRRILPINTGAPAVMSVSPDGLYVAYSRPDRTVAMMRWTDRDRDSVLPEFALPVWSLTFSPDSRLLVTGSDYTVKVWNVETGACLRSLWSQRYSLKCLMFDSNGTQLITGHDDTLLRFWRLSANSGISNRPRSLKGHTGQIRALVTSAKGSRLVSSSDDRTLQLWDVNTGKCLQTLGQDLMTPVTVMALSADGTRLLTGGEDSLVQVWQVEAGKESLRLTGHTRAITALALSADGQFGVSSSRDRSLRFWRLSDGVCLQVMTGHFRQAHGLDMSPDAQRLISISRDGTARWWDLSKGECLGTWQHSQRYWLIGCFATPNHLIAIASGPSALEIWSVTDNRCLSVLPGHNQPVWQACVSSDQQYLATASQDEEIRIWRLDTGTCVQVLHPDRPYEEVNIRGAKGLSESEERMLRSLGAMVGY